MLTFSSPFDFFFFPSLFSARALLFLPSSFHFCFFLFLATTSTLFSILFLFAVISLQVRELGPVGRGGSGLGSGR
jgi:hypothetical protein